MCAPNGIRTRDLRLDRAVSRPDWTMRACVRSEGVEPPRLAAPVSKTGVSTSSTTSACSTWTTAVSNRAATGAPCADPLARPALAASGGFEPPPTVSETAVLPGYTSSHRRPAADELRRRPRCQRWASVAQDGAVGLARQHHAHLGGVRPPSPPFVVALERTAGVEPAAFTLAR